MSNSLPELTIEAGRGERHYWQDLWRYRELLYFLAWRDVKVRYKQTLVGVAWVVVRPLLTMAVLTLVFQRIAGLHRPLIIDVEREDADQILDKIASLIPGERGVLIGMVNIHTHQAEMLLEHFEHEAGEEHVDELAASRDPERQPESRRRLRWRRPSSAR